MSDTTLDLSGWTCPAPLRDQSVVVMGHGGGGVLSAELVRHLFAPAYGNEVLDQLTDSAALGLGGARLAFSTDSYVVRPLFFPGGCIGDLAVNGTVNDLAMSGATAAYLSCAFILEEGVELEVVGRVAKALGAAAEAAQVTVATGDTKVVDAGHGDGVYITTSGIGLIPDGVDIRPQRATPGDAVIVSGPIGMHGVAIMSVREGLEFALGGAEVAHVYAERREAHRQGERRRHVDQGRTATEAATTRWREGGVHSTLDEVELMLPPVKMGCGQFLSR